MMHLADGNGINAIMVASFAVQPIKKSATESEILFGNGSKSQLVDILMDILQQHNLQEKISGPKNLRATPIL